MLPIEWELEIIARLLLSVGLGAVIGIERESLNKSAGFRTHVLVAVGACLFMTISLSVPFVRYPGDAAVDYRIADSSRIAAQIVSGIGFLGAGAIMRSGMNVRGLTTAASLWAIAAIGMAAGAGMYITAIVGTFLIYISLTYFAKLEANSRLQKQLIPIVIYFEKGAEPMCEVFSLFNNMNISIKNTRLLSEEDNPDEKYTKVELLVKPPAATDIDGLTRNLEGLPHIVKVEIAQG